MWCLYTGRHFKTPDLHVYKVFYGSDVKTIFPTGFITVYITTLRFLSLNETGNHIIVKTQSLLYKYMHVQLFW